MSWQPDGSQWLSVPFTWTQWTSGPLTIYCWVNLPSSGSIPSALGAGNSSPADSAQTGIAAFKAGASQYLDQFDDDKTGGADAAGGVTSIGSGTWQGVVGRSVYNARACFISGVKNTSGNALVAGGVFNQFVIGNYGGGAYGSGIAPAGSLIAECAIWKATLTDAECIALSNGTVNPLDVEPTLLLGYWPLVSDLSAPGPSLGTLVKQAPAALIFSASHPSVAPPTNTTTLLTGVGKIIATGKSPPISAAILTHAGSVVLTGAAPSIPVISNFIVTGIGAVDVTGAAPTISLSTQPVTIASGKGFVSLTGSVPTVAAAQTGPLVLMGGTGNLRLAGQTSIVAFSLVPITLAPGAGLLAFAGAAPSLVVGVAGAVSLTTGVGSVRTSGFAPVVSSGSSVTTLTPTIGALTATGFVPSVLKAGVNGLELQPASVAVTFLGKAPAATYGLPLAPSVGALTVTGYAPTVSTSAAVTLTPAAGAIAAQGFAPGVSLSSTGTITLAPLTGALTMRGQPPIVVNGGNFVQPNTASLVFTGMVPVFSSANTTIAPSVGALAVTGYTPSIATPAPLTIAAGPGTALITGYAPTLIEGLGPDPVTLTPGLGRVFILGWASAFNIYDEVTVDLWNSDEEEELEYEQLYPPHPYKVLA